MGVMGGVRRRCDTVTAFMFLPKDPHPRGGNSDPFSCQHHRRLDEKMLMPPFSQKSVLKGLFYSFYVFTPRTKLEGWAVLTPYQQLLQQSFLPTSYHPVQCQGYNKEDKCLFDQNELLMLDLLFSHSSASKGLLPPICYVIAL